MAQTVFEGAKRNGFAKRISWPAIFAGVVVVLVMQLMLSLLGMAFGAGSIDAVEDRFPLSGLGLGSAIWLGLTTIIALFTGGWVSARLAAMPDQTESALHGVVTWGLASLVTAYVVTSAIGGLVSGAAGVLGKTASLAGQGAMAVAPEIAKSVTGEIGDKAPSWDDVKKEAQTLLRQTGKPALQPGALEQQSRMAAQDGKSTAAEIGQDPQAADSELANLWERIEARGERVLEAADQEAFVNVLVARTDMTRQEATATVAGWQKTLDEAKTGFAQMKTEAGQQVREAVDTTASAVSKAAAWSFVGLLMGLIASAVGGYFGSPLTGGPQALRRRPLNLEQSAV